MFDEKQTRFLELASATNTKGDIKRFLKSAAKTFGASNIDEYRKNFTILSNGILYAYSYGSGTPRFYSLAGE